MDTKPKVFHLKNGSLLRISGKDRFDFLQGLITQDINLLQNHKAIYTWMLNPKGRYLHDFFVSVEGDSFLIETDNRQEELLKRLSLYKLRRDVLIEPINGFVYVAIQPTQIAPVWFSYEDPRRPKVFERIYTQTALEGASSDLLAYTFFRIQETLPSYPEDLIVERTFPLEAELETLNGLSFTKGCYMGQEPVARAYYQGVIRKKLITISLDNIHTPPPTYDGMMIEDVRSNVTYEGKTIAIAMARLTLEGA